MENLEPLKRSDGKEKFGIQYNASLFWLVVWMILFFPVALGLIALNSTIQIGAHKYQTEYSGSQFWLLFWLVCFFPIALLLILKNGFMLDRQSN